MEKLLKLHSLDNILVVIDDIAAGEHISYADTEFYFPQAIELGQKVAASFIEAGDQIIKHGVTIGIATKTIQMGDHVHLQNMKTAY